MAKNLLNKYVWLVETIYKAKQITFEEINSRWLDNDMSEGKPLALRTFHKWRVAIEEMFGLIIENEQSGKYRYYIQNADELKSGSMRSWLFNTLTVSNLMMESASIKDKILFNTLTVSNLMMESASIKDKILFDEIPDGEQYLPVILEALKKNQVLVMTYQSYWRDEANTFEVEPYCLKAFKQRWYLVCHNPYYDKMMIYALDRVHKLEPSGGTFTYPEDFNAADYFDDCFGIIADQSIDVETQTQKEIERNDEYSIFTVRLRPTFDFRQEILSQGCDIEVLEPKWFRDEMAEIAKNMWNKYEND